MNARRNYPPERRAKLLNRQPVAVRSDVFLHSLSPFTVESLRRAIEEGLAPISLDFAEDDDTVILRFVKPGYRGTFPDGLVAGPAR
ncbi:MAG TPA: hypothetical protein VLY23_05445 [Candidatus Acidoferrum sp.]|nr:hypothetical protein [Candidatus Acidoferrum sp.]